MKRYVKAAIGSAFKIAEIEVQDTTFPTPATTGSSGTLTSYSGSQDVTNGNFSNRRFGQYMRFYGTVSLTNCQFDAGALIQLTTGGATGDRITSCTFKGLALSSVQNLYLDKVEILGTGSDLLHITSDAGRMCNNITITNSCLHSPNPSPGAHLDGVQVRGVNWLTFRNNTIDVGPWRLVNGQDVLNAAVFLENANGDNRNVMVDRNYLNGGGYIFRAGAGGHVNLHVINNKFGPDGRYGTHHLNNVTPTQWYGNIRNDGSTLPVGS